MPYDKRMHTYIGAITALLIYPIFGMHLAMLAVFVVAVGKELVDAMGYGTPEVWDAVATILGGLAVLQLIGAWS